ncbi:MAG TPA: glycosyltransferase family 39 protein, partial [Thermoanaerobaculia bacterium]|nr:glycosyltransferase family 39 protein [Thermoanaerobaculia bacterium]
MRRSIAILVIVFAIAVAITNPIGNFPLDDDWDFSLSTWHLVHTGQVQHTPFTSNVAVLQYFWGALWTILFGESSTVLRFSTLFLALASTILIYVILRRSDVPDRLALFSALAFLFNPLIYWASFTYMTDVPEMFLSIAAFALLNEALHRDSNKWLITAVLVAIASFFVRQIGILNAVVPLIAIRKKKFTIAYGAATALYLVLLASGALFESKQELQIHMLRPADILIGAAHYGFLNVQNAALFFLPLVLLLCLGRLQPADRLKAVLTLLIFAVWFTAIAAHLIALGRPIPYPIRGNIFINFALGPPTLRDTFVFGMPYPFHIAYGWQIALMIVTTALAIFVAAFLIRIRNLAAIYCIAGTVIMMFLRIYFDRYSIDTMWPLAIAVPVALKDAKVRWVPLVLVAVLSIAGTAEYLAWNRARWDAYRWLESRGVTLDQMDGGYEINAMLALGTGQKFLGKPGFAVRDDRFIIGFNEVPGYKTLATFRYRRLLGPDGIVR